eukprot:CAMPEP_0118892632 /NCGR_PEP_ID=MMETSP1166-20130328/2153_1 /TAXON_ID=1104430 /ORGANISM="Chrysoreinhardia sp, Strain CCMP3193" /LENGTH=493 /DNA_ID=CAMNT_0006831375 /DNA_START=12 /DNA_END=1493 /DNA_ORIENTATION=+
MADDATEEDTASESGDESGPPSSAEALARWLERRGIIRSRWIKKAFREVDRGDFVPARCRECAYDDSPLRARDDGAGCIVHLSAPSIYAAALEALNLKAGESFLNVGSGSGYLSALAVRGLTAKAVHHCVERCPELAQRSRDSLASDAATRNVTVHTASLFDLDAAKSMKFDKIYCGAGARAEDALLLANFLKPGGAMVGPFEGRWIDDSGPHFDDLNADWRRLRRHRPQCLIRAILREDLPREEDDDENQGVGSSAAANNTEPGALEEEEEEEEDEPPGEDDDDDDREEEEEEEEESGEDDDDEEEEEEEEVPGFRRLRVREIMPVQFTALRRDDPAVGSLVLRGPAWGADSPELFPASFKLLVTVLARAAADPRGSLLLLPWHVWETGVLGYLAYDDVRPSVDDGKATLAKDDQRSRHDDQGDDDDDHQGDDDQGDQSDDDQKSAAALVTPQKSRTTRRSSRLLRNVPHLVSPVVVVEAIPEELPSDDNAP